MRYLVIGAGGTGGCIAGYMAKAGKDVTIIARGNHLAEMKKSGLIIKREDDELIIPVSAMTEQEYLEQEKKVEPLTIFVCVKGYSLTSIYPLIKKVANDNTTIIPVLNIYGTGEKMSDEFPDLKILNGCIYIAAAIESPGVIRQSGKIFRVVYGRLDGRIDLPELQQIKKDLEESEITPILSENVRLDTFQKYSFVSPMAAVGAYFDSTAGDVKNAGEIQDNFIGCVKEIQTLSDAMGIPLPENIVEINLNIMMGLTDDCTASMQKDLKKGGNSEIDGLVKEVLRMGDKYNVDVPIYKKIAEKLCR